MTKQTHLTLRLAADDLTQIEADALAAGVSVSAHVRAVLRARGNLDQLAATLARELIAELRADLQAQTAEVVSKLKVVSDQVADLATVVIRRSAP